MSTSSGAFLLQIFEKVLLPGEKRRTYSSIELFRFNLLKPSVVVILLLERKIFPGLGPLEQFCYVVSSGSVEKQWYLFLSFPIFFP